MNDVIMSAFGTVTEATDDFYIPVLDLANPTPALQNKKIKKSDLLKQSVQDNTVLQGTNDTTTGVLIYGLNVVTASTGANFCARLPLVPVKGRPVIITNVSAFKARIFPSVNGGDINGVVNGYVDIPPDKQAYAIWCWENPDPGSWTLQGRKQATTIYIPEMQIVHNQGGGISYGAGVGALQISAIGSGIDGNGNLTLTPDPQYWGTIDAIATAVKMRVFTNFVAADFASNFAPDAITIARYQAYKNAANASSSGARESVWFSGSGAHGDTNGIVSGGLLSAPVAVGDVGTFYSEIAASGYNGVGDQLGLGGQYSRYYYIFGIGIPDNAATKVYKFKIELDYIF